MLNRRTTALVIDPEPRVLSDIVGMLSHLGLHLATRISPQDSLDYVKRTRPDIVLLGISYWQEGWSSEILAASPESVVVPVVGSATLGWLRDMVAAATGADAA